MLYLLVEFITYPSFNFDIVAPQINSFPTIIIYIFNFYKVRVVNLVDNKIKQNSVQEPRANPILETKGYGKKQKKR